MATYNTEDATVEYAAAVRAGQGANSRPLQSGTPLLVPTPQMPTRLSLRQRFAILIAGADAPHVLFGPQQPLQPTGQSQDQAVIGRPWDFPVGWNTYTTPRGTSTVSFGSLKALANGYDVLRIIIERVKDKVCCKPWSIQPIVKGQKRDKRCDEMQEFFLSPDKENTWQDWLRALMDQVLVLDAPALYLRPDRAGRLYSCEIIDGAMIQPKIMADGRAPPPEIGPAYQQVIKSGLPGVDYIKPVRIGMPVPTGPDGYPLPELLYKPKNKRVDSPYGYGPVEQIITTINISLAREASLLSFYTDGSTPDMIFSCPPTWTTKQIADFQTWWDSVLAGNIPNRRGTKFVPDGTKPLNMKEGLLTDETDQWLIRIVCFAFGINPMPFIKQMNKGQEKTHHDEALTDGLEPWQQWLSDLIGYIMRVKFGYSDLKLHWEEDEALDPKEAAEVDAILVDKKIYHPDEIRAKRGDDAMVPEMREQMNMSTYNGAPNATQLSPEQAAVKQANDEKLAAAKPAPIMAPPPKEKTQAEKDHEIELAKLAAPIVNVHPSAVTVEPAEITINSPEITVEPAHINVTTPEVHNFVDVGGTSVSIKQDAPTQRVNKVVKAERMPDGTFRGVISDGTEQVIVGTRDADGNIVAKVSA